MNDKLLINEAYKKIYAKKSEKKDEKKEVKKTKKEVVKESAPFHTVNVELGYADLSYILDAIINYSSNPKFPGRGLDKSDQGLLARLRSGLQRVTDLERKQEEGEAYMKSQSHKYMGSGVNKFMSQITSTDHP